MLALRPHSNAAGYASLLIRDHYIADPFGNQYAPLVTLSVVSQATRTMRLGVWYLTSITATQVELAKQIATIGQLSGGRVEAALARASRATSMRPLGCATTRTRYASTASRRPCRSLWHCPADRL